ncbi:MAG: class I SAM-dependent methyltransferase [Microbacteriaceae bacterium]|nr:class I SAM-dependent methyltransferase [Microbacteriaceae bacterium]
MSKIESNWQYAEQLPVESEASSKARRLSLEFGVEPVSRAVASAISNIAAITQARHICEVGTGLGVSGLALLRYLPQAHLTSIDIESDYHREVKPLFQAAGVPSAGLRLIEGDAQDVLPRLNAASYDLVLLDADPAGLLEYVEHGLQLVQPGGTILVPNALWHGQVADPAARDEATTAFRDLLEMMADSPAVAASLSPAGNGLLTLTRLV